MFNAPALFIYLSHWQLYVKGRIGEIDSVYGCSCLGIMRSGSVMGIYGLWLWQAGISVESVDGDLLDIVVADEHVE